jgi:ComF family protein
MVLDWLFRPQCVGCAGLVPGPAQPMCAACQGTLVETRSSHAPPPLERIVAPWRFGGQLAAAIRRLKFTGASHIARGLAPLWAPVLAAAAGDPDAWVVPVPLHWRRRLRRGYDQTWLLAVHGCAFAGLGRPVSALRRVRGAPAQSTLGAEERAANLRGAFALRVRTELAGKTIVLVDDVVTTGATMTAAAAPLLAAGAARVIGVAVARAE